MGTEQAAAALRSRTSPLRPLLARLLGQNGPHPGTLSPGEGKRPEAKRHDVPRVEPGSHEAAAMLEAEYVPELVSLDCAEHVVVPGRVQQRMRRSIRTRRDAGGNASHTCHGQPDAAASSASVERRPAAAPGLGRGHLGGDGGEDNRYLSRWTRARHARAWPVTQPPHQLDAGGHEEPTCDALNALDGRPIHTADGIDAHVQKNRSRRSRGRRDLRPAQQEEQRANHGASECGWKGPRA